MREEKWKCWVMKSVLSLYCVASVMVIVPYIFSIGTEQRDAEYNVLAISLIAGVAVLVVILTLFRLTVHKSSVNIFKEFGIGVARAVLLLLIAGVIYMVISIICGGIAILIYGILKSKLSLEVIKGIINCATGIIILGIMPLGIAVFWKIITSDSKFLKSLGEGLRTGGRNYFKLVLLCIASYAIGIAITTVTNYIREVMWMQLMRVLLISVCGMITLNISGKICEKGVVK